MVTPKSLASHPQSILLFSDLPLNVTCQRDPADTGVAKSEEDL
jgi:hypothetical protein